MMKKWSVLVYFLLIIMIIAFTSCSGEATEYTHKILATGEPEMNEYGAPPPGEATILPREYEGAPPIIPHGLSGLTISQELNPCFNCHLLGISISLGHTATKIPESHYTNLGIGEKSEDVQPLRYNCLACHIPQTASLQTSTTPSNTTPSSTSGTNTSITFGQLAQTGQYVYVSYCIQCHGNNLVGTYSDLSTFQDASRLLVFISNQMPPGSRLSEPEYWEILGYLLVQHNYVSSETVFNTDNLSRILLISN